MIPTLVAIGCMVIGLVGGVLIGVIIGIDFERKGPKPS